MMEEKKDYGLIERIRRGDEAAFRTVFLTHYEPLCNYIWKYVRSKYLAEEVVQEVFASMWERRDKLKNDGHLRGLLYESARNRALNYIKHQKIVDQYIKENKYLNQDESYLLQDPFDHHDQMFLNSLRKAIENLPPKARQIYKMNQEEGLTYNEIASYLSISPKTVESQMRRALKTLRKSLSKFLMVFIVLVIFLFMK